MRFDFVDAGSQPGPIQPLPMLLSLARPLRAILLDWDSASAAESEANAADLARLCAQLEAAGAWIVVLAGGDAGEMERRFSRLLPRRSHPHLLVCASNGSEICQVEPDGGHLLRWHRLATPAEEQALTAVAEGVRGELVERTGLRPESRRPALNRCCIDLTSAAGGDPPPAQPGDLLAAVEDRLHEGGFPGGMADVAGLTRRWATEHGLQRLSLSCAGVCVDFGLTDNGDAAAWVRRWLHDAAGILPEEVLVVGDAFGPVAGLAGRDAPLCAALPGATFVSVGAEPGGVPETVLHLGGGSPQLLGLLRDQVRLHRASSDRRLQAGPTAGEEHSQWIARALTPPEDSHWRLVARGYRPAVEHDVETRLAIGNGALGVRASLDQPAGGSRPRTFVAGVFAQLAPASLVPGLVSAPDWLPLSIERERGPRPGGSETTAHTRMLDLRRGVLLTEWQQRDADGLDTLVRGLRLVSMADRSVAVQLVQLQADRAARLRVKASLGPSSEALEPPPGSNGRVWRARAGTQWLALDVQAELTGSVVRTETSPGKEHVWVWHAEPGEPATLLRVVGLARGAEGRAAQRAAGAALRRAQRAGPHRLIAEHEQAWAERWAASDVSIIGDAYTQRSLRFAIYHLLSAANPEDERVSIGARALTGDGYLGHVFWDTDIFLLPFYVFTWPEAARAMLMYRFHTLPGARAKAERLGYRGALYAWESADSGEETTPPYVLGADGRVIPILCGVQEHHISADVAYAVWQYWQATGDDAFLRAAGAEIILETARFWASRVALEADGRYHIRRIIGPDEYHEGVDDNAYSNVMAQWNLERGLEVASLLAERWPAEWSALEERLAVSPAELAQWSDVVARLLIPFDPASGLLEQFAGYFGLESVDLTDPAYANRTVPMDVVLGPERTRRSNVIKQADVVMLLVLLPQRFDERVREANFRYYTARCGHGSSLSPAMHAIEAARLGDVALAEHFFRQAAAMDLEDAMGNAGQGVHIASLGGLWQATVLGFAGLELRPDGLAFRPRLPAGWQRLAFAVQWRGRRVRVELDGELGLFTATLEGPAAVVIHVNGVEASLETGSSFTCRYGAAPASHHDSEADP